MLQGPCQADKRTITGPNRLRRMSIDIPPSQLLSHLHDPAFSQQADQTFFSKGLSSVSELNPEVASHPIFSSQQGDDLLSCTLQNFGRLSLDAQATRVSPIHPQHQQHHQLPSNSSNQIGLPGSKEWALSQSGNLNPASQTAVALQQQYQQQQQQLCGPGSSNSSLQYALHYGGSSNSSGLGGLGGGSSVPPLPTGSRSSYLDSGRAPRQRRHSVAIGSGITRPVVDAAGNPVYASPGVPGLPSAARGGARLRRGSVDLPSGTLGGPMLGQQQQQGMAGAGGMSPGGFNGIYAGGVGSAGGRAANPAALLALLQQQQQQQQQHMSQLPPQQLLAPQQQLPPHLQQQLQQQQHFQQQQLGSGPGLGIPGAMPSRMTGGAKGRRHSWCPSQETGRMALARMAARTAQQRLATGLPPGVEQLLLYQQQLDALNYGGGHPGAGSSASSMSRLSQPVTPSSSGSSSYMTGSNLPSLPSCGELSAMLMPPVSLPLMEVASQQQQLEQQQLPSLLEQQGQGQQLGLGELQALYDYCLSTGCSSATLGAVEAHMAVAATAPLVSQGELLQPLQRGLGSSDYSAELLQQQQLGGMGSVGGLSAPLEALVGGGLRPGMLPMDVSFSSEPKSLFPELVPLGRQHTFIDRWDSFVPLMPSGGSGSASGGGVPLGAQLRNSSGSPGVGGSGPGAAGTGSLGNAASASASAGGTGKGAPGSATTASAVTNLASMVVAPQPLSKVCSLKAWDLRRVAEEESQVAAEQQEQQVKLVAHLRQKRTLAEAEAAAKQKQRKQQHQVCDAAAAAKGGDGAVDESSEQGPGFAYSLPEAGVDTWGCLGGGGGPSPAAAVTAEGSSCISCEPSNKLFVGNIGWWVTEEDLQRWFSKFGRVTQVKVSTARGVRWSGPI